MKKISTVLVMVMLLMARFGSAADAPANEIGEKLVKDFLTNVTTLESRFEQSLTDANGKVLERTSGTLEIARPTTQFRWSYSEPYEQWLIADGVNVWSYDVDLAQVSVKPQQAALANTPALLLGGSDDALSQFDFGVTTIETETTWVRLEPRNKDSGFTRVELGFIDGALRRMVFFDTLDQTTLVALYDVVVNEPIDAARFDFSVPEFVDLVGTPAIADTTTR